jgi:hypothetical protein
MSLTSLFSCHFPLLVVAVHACKADITEEGIPLNSLNVAVLSYPETFLIKYQNAPSCVVFQEDSDILCVRKVAVHLGYGT